MHSRGGGGRCLALKLMYSAVSLTPDLDADLMASVVPLKTLTWP